MRKVIFSFYIDIPRDRIVSHGESKDLFLENYHWLVEKQKEYANSIGADYRHFTDFKKFNYYKSWFETYYPEISYYNIVNFWKINLLYNIAHDYDEVVYMDLDVIPVTKESIFDAFDLDNGTAILSGAHENQTDIKLKNTLRFHHDPRSPMAKLWNTRCMLSQEGINLDEPEVFNTGIVYTRLEELKKLDFFGNFAETLNIMRDMTTDEYYPDTIREMFGYDNETIWGYKTHINNVKWQQLEDWHFFMDKWSYIKKSAKFVHCVSKDFRYVRNWCEEKSNI